MRPVNRCFTLIEVLTCLVLGLFLTVLATGAFFQVRAVLRRTQARLEMHNTARFIYQALHSDLLAMEPEGAFYIETTADANPNLPPGDPHHTGEVRLTFLKSKTDNNNYDAHNDMALLNTDLVWTQWKWQQGISAVCSGSSSTNRFWQEWGHWVKNGLDFANANWYGKFYMNLPQPRRVAGTDAKTTLNDNTFNSGDWQDIGDYDDLARNVQPVCRGITRFDLEVVFADGTVLDPSTASTDIYPYDGVYVDGHLPQGALHPNLKRPQLFRLRFDITDFDAHFTQSFSFSFLLLVHCPRSRPSEIDMQTRRGSFLLLCIVLMSLIVIIGFSLLSSIQLQTDASTNNQRVLLAQGAAQAGLEHATEQILMDYASTGSMVLSDAESGRCSWHPSGRSPSSTAPTGRPSWRSTSRTGRMSDQNPWDADKDVRLEHPILRPYIMQNGYDGRWSWDGMSHLVGRARYYEPKLLQCRRQQHLHPALTQLLSQQLGGGDRGAAADDQLRGSECGQA